jgi:hypothetical protein
VNLTDDANNRRDAVYESSREAVKICREFREFREKFVHVCMLWVSENIGAADIASRIVLSITVPNPLRIQPVDFVECLPELARLVDINLASLLSIRLSKFFANLVRF